ncbi:MAG: 4Fe-4S dicluster domain-containing protein [Candidatus Latescibacterota bacterium]|jgi:Na+-translocating ferredoxin:NAD+ oxidoreductase RnfC subunit
MTLADQVRAAGVVGAGGAGFPSHVKASSRVEYIVANGAECEPLMHKDAELMARYPDRVVAGVRLLMEATGARVGLIGIKAKHVEAIEALQRHLGDGGVELRILGDFYPTGDEFVLVHATTGRLIPPGGIPLQVGVVVQNVETLYNVALAAEGRPVTRKFLTVAGAVPQPLSCEVPVGVTLDEVIGLAGGAPEDAALLVGGAMMGTLTRDRQQRVTKTTGGLIVLPGDHALVQRKERPEPAMHRIGKSACDQCTFCTEMCPRYLLGYDVQPHKVMRSLVFSLSGEEFWSQWGTLCCECSLCTLFACPEDLYPREACQQAKRLSKEKGFTWPGHGTIAGTAEVKPHPLADSRRIPLKQLIQRLGLAPYDRPAPLTEVALTPDRVRLPLRQHLGAPALPLVKPGDRVAAGDLVAEIPENQLGARVHASIRGTVTGIDGQIEIAAD